MNENGLPAFTDGLGDLGSGVTGLLNDFPAAGSPAKLIEYDLGGVYDIEEIRIHTGNQGADGRIFSTSVVWTSTDGISFDLLGYFLSDPSGTTNNASTPGGPDGATLVRILRDGNGVLATNATHLRFDFYSVDDTTGTVRDPFNGVNPFTGADDGLSAAFVSPLVREIDVLGIVSAIPGDFNDDHVVDHEDLVLWQNNFGTTGPVGDADGDGDVDGNDFHIWQQNVGAGTRVVASSSAVPEPNSAILLLLGSVTILLGMVRCLPAKCSAVSGGRRDRTVHPVVA